MSALAPRCVISSTSKGNRLKVQIEYRISEELAPSVFGRGEGKALANGEFNLRIVKLDEDDFRLNALRRLYLKNKGRGFYGWKIDRRYSGAEIQRAKLHLLQIKAGILPTGEECGTVYNDTEMCPLCGAGRVQVSPLRLRLTNAPKRAEIASTWGGETIISSRVVQLLIEAGATGWGIGPIQRPKRGDEEPFSLSQTEGGKRLLKSAARQGIQYPSPEFYVWVNKPEQRENFLTCIHEHEKRTSRGRRLPGGSSSSWFQLFVTSPPVELSALTRFGLNPFDDDVEGVNRCPLGFRDHVVGLNRLSQTAVRTATLVEGTDWMRSRELVGVRRGLLNPRPLLLMSARVRDLLCRRGVKGWAAETVNLE